MLLWMILRDSSWTRTLTIKIYLVIFAGIVLKLEKGDTTLSNVKQCLTLPSVAINDRKQLQCLNMIVNNKIGPLFFLNASDANKALAF